MPYPQRARWRRVAAIMAPAVMPAAVHLIFRSTAARFGAHRGYQIGFAVYWASCLTASAVIAGPRRIARTLSPSRLPERRLLSGPDSDGSGPLARVLKLGPRSAVGRSPVDTGPASPGRTTLVTD